jgi:hypothetical protein
MLEIESIYDQPDVFDRYTITFKGTNEMLGLSKNPEDPQGFSQWTTGQKGDHLGKKIKLNDLPDNVRKHLLARIKE